MEKKEMLSILEAKGELEFAVEGRYTNLRVFTGHNDNGPLPIDTIFMRLDKYQAFSAPLSEQSFNYIEDPSEDLKKLLEYGFTTPIEKLDEILTILQRMRPRKCLPW